MFNYSNSNSEIQEINEYYEELSEEVDCAEEEIYELEGEIQEEKEEIEKLTFRLELLKSKLEKNIKEFLKLKNGLEPKKKQLEEYKELLENEKQCIKDKKLEAFQKYILNIELKNIFSCQLHKNISTVNLLDKYCTSKKEFLVLREQFFLPNNLDYVSLIITSCCGDIDTENTQPTMTELKQNAGKNISDISCPRLQPLLTEISNIDNTNRTISTGSKFVFSRPFLIGGQTSTNRTGYGCEWIGGGDYIEGTLYGEVTDFMAVGIIVD